MSLGQKQSFTGMLRKQIVNKGSKSEHEAIVLDLGKGQSMKVQLQGANPFSGSPELNKLVGQHVKIEGIAGSGVNTLFVEKMSDVVHLGPPGRPKKPYTPRP